MSLIDKLKKVGSTVRPVQRFVFDERPIIKTVSAVVHEEPRKYFRNVGPAVLQLALVLPVFKAGKIALGARAGGEVLYHGTTAAAAQQIKKTGFRAGEVYLSPARDLAERFGQRYAAKPTIVKATLRPTAAALRNIRDPKSAIVRVPAEQVRVLASNTGATALAVSGVAINTVRQLVSGSDSSSDLAEVHRRIGRIRPRKKVGRPRLGD